VRQERTSGRGDPVGSANPTRSKAKRGTWAARPLREEQSPGRPLRWMATAPARDAQNPAYRPAHRHTRTNRHAQPGRSTVQLSVFKSPPTQSDPEANDLL